MLDAHESYFEMGTEIKMHPPSAGADESPHTQEVGSSARHITAQQVGTPKIAFQKSSIKLSFW